MLFRSCPLPAFRNCFVEFTQRLNVLLMNLWGRKCVLPILLLRHLSSSSCTTAFLSIHLLMLNITHYQRNANQNHSEVPFHASQIRSLTKLKSLLLIVCFRTLEFNLPCIQRFIYKVFSKDTFEFTN